MNEADEYNRKQIDSGEVLASDMELLQRIFEDTDDMGAREMSALTWNYQRQHDDLVDDGQLGPKTLAKLRGDEPLEEEFILGIDVAHWQGDIDWSQIANAGYKFAWIKATQGAHRIDPRLDINAYDATKAGLRVGYYHYLDTEHGATTQEQVDFFLTAIGSLQTPTLPIALDVEKETELSRNDYTEMCGKFMLECEMNGYFGVVYTSKRIVDRDLRLDHNLGKYALWAPRYNDTNTPPEIPKGWDNWSIWQYTSKGSVPGVSGNCDINRARRSWWDSL